MCKGCARGGWAWVIVIAVKINKKSASSDINCAHDEPARKRQQKSRKEGEEGEEE